MVYNQNPYTQGFDSYGYGYCGCGDEQPFYGGFYGYNRGSSFALILVLFILLVIITAS